MTTKNTPRAPAPAGRTSNTQRLEQVVANAHRARQDREAGYREQSLRIHPWVCGRCGREFTRDNLRELTVHHKDHNHDNNPPDGSNWENLCIYCHENEHARYVDHTAADGLDLSAGGGKKPEATHNPFGELKGLLK
uniref:Putative HNH nuclease YajD n=1 Tax=Candidatus Kentrum sp. DK TaxID=2126562 RepID=A0A450T396_9GAMM|nr:MAG: HNH endonuclease [Candidatus Kentron sp. DK]VFJ61007.1 MAG: HNH endonuclease [Candidatus Kentron sp. DK]